MPGVAQDAVDPGRAHVAREELRKVSSGTRRALLILRQVSELIEARERAPLPVAAVKVSGIHAKLQRVIAADLGYQVLDVPVQRAALAERSASDAGIGPHVEVGDLLRRHARGQPDLLRDTLFGADRNEREELPAETDAESVDQRRRERMRVRNHEVAVGLIVVTIASDVGVGKDIVARRAMARLGVAAEQ